MRARSYPSDLTDEQWALVRDLIPVHPGGRPRKTAMRDVLDAIFYVLRTGCQWEFLPKELGFGSGMTCWRRLVEWHEAGVWDRLHQVLLAELHAAGNLAWSRAVIDSSHVRALKGGPKPGRARSTVPGRAPSTT